MKLPRRNPTLSDGFTRLWLKESFPGPINEISGEDVQRIKKFVGTGGVSISKLASFLGIHQLHAHDLVDFLLTIGVLREVGRNRVAVREDRSEVQKKNLCLTVISEDNSSKSSERMCEVSFRLGEKEIELVRVFSLGEDITDRVFLPKKLREELNKECSEKQKVLRVKKRGLFS